MRMTEFSRVFAKKANCTVNVTRQLLDGFVEAMYECLAAGERIHIKNFGAFYVADVAAREQFDPNSRELRVMPPYKSIRFRPSPKLREFLENNDFDMEYGYIVDFDITEEEDDV